MWEDARTQRNALIAPPCSQVMGSRVDKRSTFSQSWQSAPTPSRSKRPMRLEIVHGRGHTEQREAGCRAVRYEWCNHTGWSGQFVARDLECCGLCTCKGTAPSLPVSTKHSFTKSERIWKAR